MRSSQDTGRDVPCPLPEAAMDADEFWALIDLLGGTFDAAAESRLSEALDALPAEKLLGFNDQLTLAAYAADRDDLCDASDDGFLYERLGLVAAGRDVYTAVLAADPPRKLDGRWQGEGLAYVAPRIWERRYGGTAERLPYETPVSKETGSNLTGWPQLGPAPAAGGRSLAWCRSAGGAERLATEAEAHPLHCATAWRAAAATGNDEDRDRLAEALRLVRRATPVYVVSAAGGTDAWPGSREHWAWWTEVLATPWLWQQPWRTALDTAVAADTAAPAAAIVHGLHRTGGPERVAAYLDDLVASGPNDGPLADARHTLTQDPAPGFAELAAVVDGRQSSDLEHAARWAEYRTLPPRAREVFCRIQPEFTGSFLELVDTARGIATRT